MIVLPLSAKRSPVRTLRLLLLLILVTFALNVAAEAAPSVGAEKQSGSTSKDDITFAAHRAIYDMHLTSVKNGSTIVDVSGNLLFEWTDMCDGWAIQQNMHLSFTHAEGDESSLTSNEVTWESKDGKIYNFNIRHTNDGKETENYRGKAHLTGADAKAIYSIPEGKTVDLSEGTVFPTAHTRMILVNAKAGQRFFTRRVFDGTDEDGLSDISVFVGSPRVHSVTASSDAQLESSPLLAATEWPIHMAFFKLSEETDEPDYEMDLGLLENGVVRSIKIDYGDFVISGRLKSIEPISLPHC